MIVYFTSLRNNIPIYIDIETPGDNILSNFKVYNFLFEGRHEENRKQLAVYEKLQFWYLARFQPRLKIDSRSLPKGA